MARGLSRRQRIGVVLSVLWFIGGSLWGFIWGASQSQWIWDLYGLCLGTTTDWNQCEHRLQLELANDRFWTNRLLGVLIIGVVPIFLGWLSAWICIRITRWVMRGVPS